ECGGALPPQLEQPLQRVLKFATCHVIGKTTERGIGERQIRRIPVRPAHPAERLALPYIMDTVFSQSRFQRGSGKLWISARAGIRSNVDQAFDVRSAQQRDKSPAFAICVADRVYRGRQSARAPEAFTTFPHFSIS